mmetsp:Transcript_53856/g.144179  ORF Transcript_53856/g.144179 Transcript_53856/m.144179 type:complete len:233 (-) Transcript_53856:925-1623(-)
MDLARSLTFGRIPRTGRWHRWPQEQHFSEVSHLDLYLVRRHLQQDRSLKPVRWQLRLRTGSSKTKVMETPLHSRQHIRTSLRVRLCRLGPRLRSQSGHMSLSKVQMAQRTEQCLLNLHPRERERTSHLRQRRLLGRPGSGAGVPGTIRSQRCCQVWLCLRSRNSQSRCRESSRRRNPISKQKFLIVLQQSVWQPQLRVPLRRRSVATASRCPIPPLRPDFAERSLSPASLCL